MSTSQKTLEALANRDYKWGFVSDIEADTLPPGLNEDVIRAISAKKAEPEFMDRFGVPATVRASLGLYNTPAELETLATAVRTAREIIGG